MKNFGKLKIVLLAVFCLLLVGATANAQRRGRGATRTTAPKTTTAAANTAEIKAGAQRVGVQVKNLTQFIYVLGGVRKDIEAIDAAAKTGKASQSAIQQNDASKKIVAASIRNVRTGLTQLEDDFSASPVLRRFMPQLLGVSDIAAQAEQQAANNQFDQAGRRLIDVVNKLTDVLAAMR